MTKIYRPQSIFSVGSEIRRKISNFIHFDFAFRGFRFSEAGGSNLCREGSFTFPLSHNYKFTNKKKRHLTVSNIVKCLYFSGFAVILPLPFVSIKQFSFQFFLPHSLPASLRIHCAWPCPCRIFPCPHITLHIPSRIVSISENSSSEMMPFWSMDSATERDIR